MSTAVLPEYRDLLALRPLVREATALGARFRLSGAAVEIAGGANLPLTLRQELARYEESGLLFIYLDTKGAEQTALDLGERLGVYALLIEERYEARIAVRDLLEDLRRHGGYLGVDIETAARPEYDNRPWITLNKDGTPSARQPTEEDEDAIPAALYPHLAEIGTLQMYAGGRTCYVLRGAALQMVLRSHWFRRQSLVVHNATFEAAFLQHHCNGYHLPAGRKQHFRFRLDCTQQASGLLIGVGFGGEARKLDKVAKKVLKLDVPKELATSNWTAKELSLGQAQYAASDAIIAWRLWSKAEPALRKTQRWDAYELQRRVIPAVADMELRGLGFDRARHQAKVAEWAQELAQARQEYFELRKQEPPSKPAQVRAWLADVLTAERLARWNRTPTGLLSTKAEDLKRLGDIASARPVLTLLAKEKLLSSFGADFAAKLNPVTHRFHTHYQIAGTKAGRFSASGPNLQQLPQTADPTFKQCIVAKQGNLLVGGDYSQIELRGAAFISKDRNMTRGFAEGRDQHKATAAKMARCAVDEVTALQRQKAKPVNYGAIFGIQAPSLAANAFADYGVEMTVAEADQALKAFFAFFYGYDDWRWEHYRLCQRRGYVLIEAGRVVEARWEPGRKIRFAQCCNLPIQGGAANAMLRAIILLYPRLKASAIRGGMVASIHDELLLEVHEDDAEATRVLLTETMIEAFETTYPGAPIVNLVETKIGRSWADVK